MKFVHTADWHLGKYLYGRSLLPDQEHFVFESFLPFLREECPNFVLLAGDVFDRQIAPVEAVRLFDRFLVEMNALQIPLCVVAGNHDGAERMAVGASLLRKSGVYIASRPEDLFQPVRIEAGGECAEIFLLPWCEPAQVRALLDREDLRTFNDAYTALLCKARAAFTPGARHLLAAHCFVAGGAVSASESPLYVGGGGDVSAAAFEGFDYAAFGHLHAPQRAGENGRYSGSPLKYSFDEANQRKSITIVHLENENIRTEEKVFAPLRDLRVLSGTFEQLTQEPPSQDYIRAALLDEGPVYMPMDRLRERFPNILGVDSLWLSRAAGAESSLRSQLMTHRVDDAEIFRQFMKTVCGEEPAEGDLKLFLEALRAQEDED